MIGSAGDQLFAWRKRHGPVPCVKCRKAAAEVLVIEGTAGVRVCAACAQEIEAVDADALPEAPASRTSIDACMERIRKRESQE